MKKIYKVALSEEEQAELQGLISKGKTSARKMTRARILLLAHAGEKDAAVARALQTSVSTVERTRKNLVLEGLKPALEEAPRPGARPKLDVKGHRFLVALAGSTPPLGRGDWTLELLSDRLVALGYVESFSKEAVRRALQKNDLQPWRHKQWAIPTPVPECRLAHGRGDQPLHAQPPVPQSSRARRGDPAHRDQRLASSPQR